MTSMDNAIESRQRRARCGPGAALGARGRDHGDHAETKDEGAAVALGRPLFDRRAGRRRSRSMGGNCVA